ncbi:hypothetical protein JN06_02251 [Bacteroides zoogleoformans]|uniref:Uncharacterized protein n=1 Tax=Bacteroides zoogleoformans TaxID=28119 RepID=A0ABN5IHN5_9BACE|nr:hypothetical protein [Bacteroides zoogleoformans]AVM52285.1 hypothetical protein C4H11_04390 [Bacteroides zoogleoformans]TWJ11288.1 hypothetical protein JN06_02251 [Bacteroides zoogleoformans]
MKTFSGLSFYDSLNKLTVGVLLLLLIVGEEMESGIVFYIVAFMVGCVYQAIIRQLTKSWLSLNEEEIKEAFTKENPNLALPESIKRTYLATYYEMGKLGWLMNIPILEALENFMRNMFLIILLYLIAFLGDCNTVLFLFPNGNKCGIAFFLVFLMIAAMWLRCYYQKEIYRLVWEAYSFLLEEDYKDIRSLLKKKDKSARLKIKIRKGIMNFCEKYYR